MGALISFLFSFVVAAAPRPRIYFAPKPASIRVRNIAPFEQGDEISLSDLVATHCPTLHTSFRPAWWLKGGHLQTLWSVAGDFSKIDKVEYERTLLRTVDGGTLGLDFTGPSNSELLPEETPVVVVLHGLTGGSYESYVRAVLAPACTPLAQGGLGYRAVVVNFRGCAGVPLTSPRLYSAGTTDDIRTALMYISATYPKAPLLGVGFSLGANVLTRYLAEEGERSRLNAGILTYTRLAYLCDGDYLALELRREWQSHLATAVQFPDSPMAAAMPAILEMKRPFLADYDQAMTCLAGGASPPFPFPTVCDYYTWASTDDALREVRVPLLAINAADDPIVTKLPVDEKDGCCVWSPYVVFGVTEGGGHLGWFEKDTSMPFGVKRWITKPVLEWLRVMGDVVVDERCMTALRQVDGFVKEVGRDDVGYQKLKGGGHVVGVEGQKGVWAGL
ncbi:hypothetical protein EIP91_006480 [Steccherinum ochraceum]|uniref:AB hydrolase-1 domain-containing protein n=1 Tax=Steccherinum ochraceum TaxID=92696 RepID=A0A4R0RR62_9APHY|nr:hypothetical protein EIP91_006480 [Steccherinum ochraceum]